MSSLPIHVDLPYYAVEDNELLINSQKVSALFEQAGGRATNGREDILELQPTELHQRTPLYMGASEYVDLAEEYLSMEEVLAEG